MEVLRSNKIINGSLVILGSRIVQFFLFGISVESSISVGKDYCRESLQ